MICAARKREGGRPEHQLTRAWPRSFVVMMKARKEGEGEEEEGSGD